jgi:hypothetical protein
MTLRPLLVRRAHTLSRAEVLGRLERAARLAQERHHVAWCWRNNTLEVWPPPGLAQGARGRVFVGDSDLSVELVLPLRFGPARCAIESRLASKLDDLLRVEVGHT